MRVKVGREWVPMGSTSSGEDLGPLSPNIALGGPVERRQATPEERAAWGSTGSVDRRRGKFNETSAAIREHAHRGGEANRRRVAAGSGR